MFSRALHILNASLWQLSPPRFQPRSRSLQHWMMSFMLLYLTCRPYPSDHDRPCEPLAETESPHTHVCGSHMADPNKTWSMCTRKQVMRRAHTRNLERTYNNYYYYYYLRLLLLIPCHINVQLKSGEKIRNGNCFHHYQTFTVHCLC